MPQAASGSSAVVAACRSFATTQAAGHSPLYERLAVAIAEDADLVELLLAAPPGQQRPTLLLAAVHDLLLAGADHGLREHYPRLARGPATLDPAAAFVDFCATFHSEVSALVARGGTQTNDVRRCAPLLVGLGQVLHRLPGPFALHELGCSAGLNLAYDRYAYELPDRTIGDPTSTVRIPVIATSPLLDRLHARDLLRPSMRTGIDRAPVDASDPTSCRWLRAFVWPELHDDDTRLTAALASMAADPIATVAADAIDAVRTVVAEAPPELTPIVFSSTLLTYLDPTERQELGTALAAVAASRSVGWIALEAPGLYPATGQVDALPTHLAKDDTTFTLLATTWRNGRRSCEPLARVEADGRWMADPTAAA